MQALRASSVALDASAAKGDAPVWVQIAAAGEFKGHPTGPFTLDEAVFTEIIRNFHTHPDYVPGGKSDVLPWDFHHLSEQGGEGVSVYGAPAQGWVRELEVRGAGLAAQLWALTRWLPLAKKYIREGNYKHASVTIWPNQKHPVTGERIGYWLSSVALVNDPFVQGMTPLAASSTRQENPMATQAPTEEEQLAAAINAHHGRNKTEQAVAFVRAQPGGMRLNYEDAHIAAAKLLKRIRMAGVKTLVIQ